MKTLFEKGDIDHDNARDGGLFDAVIPDSQPTFSATRMERGLRLAQSYSESELLVHYDTYIAYLRAISEPREEHCRKMRDLVNNGQ